PPTLSGAARWWQSSIYRCCARRAPRSRSTWLVGRVRSGHYRKAHAELGFVAPVIAQQGFAVAVEVLQMQVAVHVEPGAPQGPGDIQLGRAAAAGALPVQG